MTMKAPEKASKSSRGVADSGTEAEAPRPAAVGKTPKPRWKLWGAALGIAVMLVSGLAFVYVNSTTSKTVSVLTTKNAVERGHAITEADLATISIAGGQNADTVPAKDATSIVGQIAAVDLPAGSLITSSNVIDTLPVPDGKTIVGVSVTTAQLPSYALAAGDVVRIVDTPVAQGEPPADDPKTFKATVFTTSFDEKNNVWIVDLIVPSREAPSIAARAATQRIALVLDSLGE